MVLPCQQFGRGAIHCWQCHRLNLRRMPRMNPMSHISRSEKGHFLEIVKEGSTNAIAGSRNIGSSKFFEISNAWFHSFWRMGIWVKDVLLDKGVMQISLFSSVQTLPVGLALSLGKRDHRMVWSKDRLLVYHTSCHVHVVIYGCLATLLVKLGGVKSPF